MEHHWRHALGRLYRDRAYARREGRGTEPILARPRAAAAAMEDDGTELRQGIRVGSLFDFINQRAAAEDLWIPER